MKGNPVTGFGYLLEGARLLTRPGIRRYVIMPLTINIVLFGLLIWWGYSEVATLNHWILGHIPHWLDWLTWLIWPVFFLAALMLLMYGFTLLANLVAAPFNGFLAERVELELTGERPGGETGFAKLALVVPRSLAREGRKWLYFLPLLIGAAVLYVIPVINFAAPFVWLVLSAWMLAIEYIDFPMDNHELPFTAVREGSRAASLTSLGFGTAVMLGTMIPFVNLFVVPAAVSGATVYFTREIRQRYLPQRPAR